MNDGCRMVDMPCVNSQVIHASCIYVLANFKYIFKLIQNTKILLTDIQRCNSCKWQINDTST